MTLEAIITNNLKNLRKGDPGNYVLIGLLPSRDVCDWYIEEFNRTIAPEAQAARSPHEWQRITGLLEGLLQQAVDNDNARLQNTSC